MPQLSANRATHYGFENLEETPPEIQNGVAVAPHKDVFTKKCNKRERVFSKNYMHMVHLK